MLTVAALEMLVLVRSRHLSGKVRPIAEKHASKSWAIFLYTHTPQNSKTKIQPTEETVLAGISLYLSLLFNNWVRI